MLLVTLLVFGLLLWIARLKDSNLLFPPALFAGIWLFTLTGLLLWGDAYYPVPDKAYVVFIVGGVGFTLGSILMAQLLRTPSEAGEDRWTGSRLTHLALDVCLIVCAATLPFYWRELAGCIVDVDFSTVLRNIREEQILLLEERTSAGIVANIGGVAPFIAMAMVYEVNGTRGRLWRAVAAVGLALIYGMMTGTKMSALSLAVALCLILSARAKRLRLSTMGAFAVLALFFFFCGLLLINLARESFSGSFEALRELGHVFRLYWLSALVAFGVIALNPNAMETTQPVNRFFLDTARSLGFPVNPPLKYAEFVNVNVNEVTNIYTVYGSFFKDHGWIGTVFFMAALGAMMTFLYRNAMRRRPMATILFGHFGYYVIFSSITGEYFFFLLNTHIKFFFFLWVLYSVLPALEARRVAAHA